ncbi:MAG TPA: hypothetical protein VGS12_09785 [Caulobacteraceae bacterium]|nr:hypothetical protein [Caulobacteraceae bacterium]
MDPYFNALRGRCEALESLVVDLLAAAHEANPAFLQKRLALPPSFPRLHREGVRSLVRSGLARRGRLLAAALSPPPG